MRPCGCAWHNAFYQIRQADLQPAVCYELGLGVTQNYQEARRLFALSSAQGDATATKYLNELEETIRAECPLLGKRVVITGTSREDLNGRVGVAQNFDAPKGRYVVQLDDDEGKQAVGRAMYGHKGLSGGIWKGFYVRLYKSLESMNNKSIQTTN